MVLNQKKEEPRRAEFQKDENPINDIDELGLMAAALAAAGRVVVTIITAGGGPEDVPAVVLALGVGLVVLGGYGWWQSTHPQAPTTPTTCPINSTPKLEDKAPGKPDSDDGYTPPKRGPGSDGEPVKNPNGPGYGWLDDAGNVWVPTGEGATAHGGPHWDVQIPGGGYYNVYPGGRIR